MGIHLVEADIREGMQLTLGAQRAYRALDTGASDLYRAAELAYYDLLTSISCLTSDEADIVEPDFTAFETLLLKLGECHFGSEPGIVM